MGMRRFTDPQSKPAVWIGVGASFALHVAGAALIAGGWRAGDEEGSGSDDASPVMTMELPRVFEPPKVTVGQDDGSPEAMAWLGFADARRHVATPWIQDQAAFTASASTPGPLPNGGEPIAASGSVEGAMSEPMAAMEALAEQSEPDSDVSVEEAVEVAEAESELDAEGEAVAAAMPELSEAAPGLVSREDVARMAASMDALASSAIAALSEAGEGLRMGVPWTRRDGESAIAGASGDDAPVVEPVDAARAAEAVGESGELADGSDGGPVSEGSSEVVVESESRNSDAARPGSGAPGELSDREALAASIERAPRVEWGRPLSAKGLRVRTVRPEFTAFTTVVSSRNEPVVRLSFGRDGRVRQAVFLRRSGNPNVDQPVLDAVYRWSAEGTALESLRAEGPGSTIDIDVRITR
ncbi:MAG: energy transducer TonB [Phycisphaerales bacterium]